MAFLRLCLTLALTALISSGHFLESRDAPMTDIKSAISEASAGGSDEVKNALAQALTSMASDNSDDDSKDSDVDKDDGKDSDDDKDDDSKDAAEDANAAAFLQKDAPMTDIKSAISDASAGG